MQTWSFIVNVIEFVAPAIILLVGFYFYSKYTLKAHGERLEKLEGVNVITKTEFDETLKTLKREYEKDLNNLKEGIGKDLKLAEANRAIEILETLQKMRDEINKTFGEMWECNYEIDSETKQIALKVKHLEHEVFKANGGGKT